MDLRRYELVTVATALALESSYCTLAHGKVLDEKVLAAGQTEAFARDFRQADLSPAEKAMVAFAKKIALRAHAVMQEDVDELRGHGFSDEEIVDIVSATTARCFMSKFLDAVGAAPDHYYADMAPRLKDVLTVGRAIEARPAASPERG
jgi:uncharacterized peroxidase-related enzyme